LAELLLWQSFFHLHFQKHRKKESKMTLVKRIFLFLLVNILVMFTITTVLSLLGVQPYLQAGGLNLGSLAVFCLVWGMGGAFISLGLSRVMAKWAMGVKLIDPHTHDPRSQDLVQKVYRLARAAGLEKMPEVGIYDSPDINAFATGPTRNRSLVAVSSGLLQQMDAREVEGVLAHEVAHIANGDMVTMTLIQGIVNAFVMFLARILAFAISNFLRKDDEEGASHGMQYILTFVLEIIFMILGTIVVAWFSRWREYRADAGGARLGGREQMISALKALQRVSQRQYAYATEPASPTVQALQISKGGRKNWFALFSTHPDLSDRIARLEMGK
jgi:heat shock protein HtpX